MQTRGRERPDSTEKWTHIELHGAHASERERDTSGSKTAAKHQTKVQKYSRVCRGALCQHIIDLRPENTIKLVGGKWKTNAGRFQNEHTVMYIHDSITSTNSIPPLAVVHGTQLVPDSVWPGMHVPHSAEFGMRLSAQHVNTVALRGGALAQAVQAPGVQAAECKAPKHQIKPSMFCAKKTSQKAKWKKNTFTVQIHETVSIGPDVTRRAGDSLRALPARTLRG
jgi:hypothetical protein